MQADTVRAKRRSAYRNTQKVEVEGLMLLSLLWQTPTLRRDILKSGEKSAKRKRPADENLGKERGLAVFLDEASNTSQRSQVASRKLAS